MVSLEQLFDSFALAYQHSLYAIEQEEQKLSGNRTRSREYTKKKFEKDRSRIATSTANSLMACMHQISGACKELTSEPDTVVRSAEYLVYGEVQPQNIEQILFSDNTIPWVMPFLGHNNVLIESNGSDSQILGLQIAIHALQQTAPGQLNITVINPQLRPEFSPLSNLPGFKVLTKAPEIQDEFVRLSEEILQTDTLLQGRFPSLVALREAAQQPVGQLRLLVIQDLPTEASGDYSSNLITLAQGAPRAGIAIILICSKTTATPRTVIDSLKKLSNFLAFSKKGDHWHCSDVRFENLRYSFPILSSLELSNSIKEIQEEAKKTTAITIPFEEIEDTENMWSESSIENLTFSLGKSGLDTVSVCLGDRVSQLHNILISGAAGKGKSNLIEVMIHSLCVRYSPDELELYLLDFKDGLTFKPYSAISESSWLPHARMLGLESDRDVGLAVLKDLEAERRRRAVLFGDSSDGVHDYESYRQRHSGAILPRIVLIVDEYQKLFDINDEISEDAAFVLENLVRQGRACAIHIILASQSISGAVGLLGKDERIYAQFPVRIALQNTLSESYQLFGIGNDAAAQLRVRGEAVINENYGAIDSNKRFTVAYANPPTMKALRKILCSGWQSTDYPVVFRKKDTMDFGMFIPDLKRWRRGTEEGSAIHLPCGIQLSVRKDVLPITFANDVGRNVILLGAAEDLQVEGAVPGKKNTAVGILQGFGFSLALQHPKGDARFVLIDGLATDVRRNSNMLKWLKLMERFGFPVETVAAKDAADWLLNFQQEISFGETEEDTYIFGLGMDRCSNFSEMSLSGESGASAFQSILKMGAKRIHFLGWWSNVSMFKEHIGFGNDGYLGTRILLRMDTDTAREVLGPFVNWSVRENRAFIHDSSDLAADAVVIPIMPFSDRDCGVIEAEAW